MILHIKNMVCRHCIHAVQNVLDNRGIGYFRIDLGEVESKTKLSSHQLKALASDLKPLGFELLTDKASRDIEKIKIELIQLLRTPLKDDFQLSDFIQKQIGKEYSALSKLFSELEGVTLEKYFILLKVERVKELIVYDELNLSEIAETLGYSSPAYLSTQFKKITGLPPSHFNKVASEKRLPLNQF